MRIVVEKAKRTTKVWKTSIYGHWINIKMTLITRKNNNIKIYIDAEKARTMHFLQ